MPTHYNRLPVLQIPLPWHAAGQPLDVARHSIGIGGVHPDALPPQAAQGLRCLAPKVVRVFLQEYFFTLRDAGCLDWDALDVYMASVAGTGAGIMACICFKPYRLYPDIDQDCYQPNDLPAWQEFIRAVVHRYSVEKPWVTHWAIGNEVNIGEAGGCPYRMQDPADFVAYYALTAPAVRQAAPHTAVGGPSFAGGGQDAADYLAAVARGCKQRGLPLDFVAYNLYSDRPAEHAAAAQAVADAVQGILPDCRVYCTELNVDLGCQLPSVEELAWQPRRAAGLAAILHTLQAQNRLDGSFYYHAYDQVCDPALFAPWYAAVRYMAHHWNDSPHRLGLFGQDGRPRPQYFVYDFLRRMPPHALAQQHRQDLYLTAARDDRRLAVLAANYPEDPEGGQDCILQLALEDLPAGMYNLALYRIDADTAYTGLALAPVEQRRVYAHADFNACFVLPRNAVAFWSLTPTIR